MGTTFSKPKVYSVFRYILPSIIMGVGIAMGAITSIPLGIAIAGFGIAIVLFDHVCLSMDREFIATSSDRTRR